TPWMESPIDSVTTAEADEYGHFREEYSKLWRTYFDPIGLRLALDARRVRAEMHILPLAGSEQYRTLRQFTQMAKFRFEPLPGSLVDFRLSVVGEGQAIFFHVGSSARLRDMGELLIRWEEGVSTNPRQEYDRLFWKLPLGVGLSGPDAVGMDSADGFVKMFQQGQLLTGEPKVSTYKDVKLHRLPINGKTYREGMAQLPTIIAFLQ